MPNQKEKTISDFGEQWTHYTKNEGAYASVDVLQDTFGPLLDIKELKNKKVADIGSGTGRIVNMLLDAGVSHVTAIEPSECFAILKENTKKRSNSITYINELGEALPPDNYDYVISLGVIHHIPHPEATIHSIWKALSPDGKIIIWLYGFEGNELYLNFVSPLRFVTTRLPHKVLHGLTHIILFFLNYYIRLCKYIKLPLRDYMNNILAKYSTKVRFVTIYDQLNPAYSKYYKKDEVITLLQAANFKNIKLYHRHGYSWTAIADKQ